MRPQDKIVLHNNDQGRRKQTLSRTKEGLIFYTSENVTNQYEAVRLNTNNAKFNRFNR